MLARRCPTWLVLMAAAIQVAGAARAVVPAQDGLKFLRVAREFHAQPFADVIKHCDQHPLYPICVAAAEPAVSFLLGKGPDAWRVAGQAVSIAAFLAALYPIFGLARSLFDARTATLAAMMFALLPATSEVGHDTLSDALALLGMAWSLRLGERALRGQRLLDAVGCGLAAGVGYWARPEVLIAPAAVGLVAACRAIGRRRPLDESRRPRLFPGLAAVGLPALVLVGGYATLKGEVSERLSLRIRGVGWASAHPALAAIPAQARGLTDPRLDFSAKEESAGRTVDGLASAAARLVSAWAEGLGFVFGATAIWGMIRVAAGGERSLISAYLIMFSCLLILHAATVGYLSGRHALGLVVASLPWSAAGARSIVRGLLGRVGGDEAAIRRRCLVAMALLAAAAVAVQARKPPHPTRWGHLAAGRWLKAHAGAGEATLDTRGWAAFVAGGPCYDYWHVRQALSDSRLRYVVVGADELRAQSARASTLRSLLAMTSTQVAAFPAREGGTGADIQIYRYQRPSTWEGLAR